MGRNSKAFTMVECLICLAVAGVIMAITIPTFSKIRKSAIYRGEVMSFVSALHLAKSSAVRKNCPAVLEVGEGGIMVFLDSGIEGVGYGDWQKQEGEEVLVEHLVPEKFLVSSNYPNDKLRFRSVPGVKPGSIYIDDQDGKITRIVTNTMGRIRTERVL